MIGLDVQLVDAPPVGLAGLAEQLVQALGEGAGQHPAAVLRHPDQVEAQAVLGVAAGPVGGVVGLIGFVIGLVCVHAGL